MPRAATHAARRSPGGSTAPAHRAPLPAAPPARRRTRSRAGPAPRSRASGATRAAGAIALRLPARSASGLLDGLLRGRAWVAFVGALLAGIVFLNVALLELNGGIARTGERVAELRRENAELRLEVARLGSTERIQRVAEKRGFVMPEPGDVTYLEADPAAGAQPSP